jgi:hypothetical protein
MFLTTTIVLYVPYNNNDTICSLQQHALTQVFHFQDFFCDVIMFNLFLYSTYMVVEYLVCVCVRVCVCAHALDGFFCSEGLRFCDLFLSFMQICSRKVWLPHKWIFFIRLHMRNFSLSFTCFTFTHKGKHTNTIEKFHIFNLGRTTFAFVATTLLETIFA